jgi:hypothetical protein
MNLKGKVIDRSERELLEYLDYKIKNLEPKLRESLLDFSLTCCKANPRLRFGQLTKLIREKIGTAGKSRSQNSIKYWTLRGWGEEQASKKSKEHCDSYLRNSPFGEDNWLAKINPLTGINYTQEEALFKARSCKKLNVEYWIVRGHSEEDSIKLRSQFQSELSKRVDNTRKDRTATQIGYWLKKGFSQEEAKEKLRERQSTIGLKFQINKYGYEKGVSLYIGKRSKRRKHYTVFRLYCLTKAFEVSKNYDELIRNYKSLMRLWKGQASKESLKYFIFLYECLKENYTINFGAMGLKELRLFGGKEKDFYRYDFSIEEKKLIIEYDGIYWHDPKNPNPSEKEKFKIAKKNGYKVLRISSTDAFDKNCLKIIKFFSKNGIMEITKENYEGFYFEYYTQYLRKYFQIEDGIKNNENN